MFLDLSNRLNRVHLGEPRGMEWIRENKKEAAEIEREVDNLCTIWKKGGGPA